jgi:hypothetical protein
VIPYRRDIHPQTTGVAIGAPFQTDVAGVGFVARKAGA